MAVSDSNVMHKDLSLNPGGKGENLGEIIGRIWLFLVTWSKQHYNYPNPDLIILACSFVFKYIFTVQRRLFMHVFSYVLYTSIVPCT